MRINKGVYGSIDKQNSSSNQPASQQLDDRPLKQHGLLTGGGEGERNCRDSFIQISIIAIKSVPKPITHVAVLSLSLSPHPTTTAIAVLWLLLKVLILILVLLLLLLPSRVLRLLITRSSFIRIASLFCCDFNIKPIVCCLVVMMLLLLCS